MKIGRRIGNITSMIASDNPIADPRPKPATVSMTVTFRCSGKKAAGRRLFASVQTSPGCGTMTSLTKSPDTPFPDEDEHGEHGDTENPPCRQADSHIGSNHVIGVAKMLHEIRCGTVGAARR